MLKNGLVRITLLAVMVLLFQGTWALAGTTGALNGVVTLQDGTPLAGAKVTASSPSESVSTTTDNSGHFTFVSLIPDTYTVTASKDNYDTQAQSGVSVFADNTATVHISTQAKTRTLGVVTTTATAALVKPGTTSDVYSVNAATQEKVAALGGGGGLDNAYSAIASVPGVVVPPGQQGWFQTIHIRGGDFDQVGYEFDGVPVLRSYDNYPTTNASALGQQELQVYTGAAPANSESQGLAGYINQVIKTGTYPGSATAKFTIGGPSLSNSVGLEAAGATPDRNFSYFIGLSVADGSQRFIDNKNGAGVDALWGTPVGLNSVPGFAANASSCITSPANAGNGYQATYLAGSQNYLSCYAAGQWGPGGVQLGPFSLGGQSHIADRENVLNLHFGIPHKNDAGKDDVQLLLDTSQIYNTFYSSASDFGATGLTPYPNGHLYTGPVGVPLPANFDTNFQLYAFPNSPGALTGGIPYQHRDGTTNGQGIMKLQYQHNIGSSAYFRVYGYTFYSDWLQNGPNGAQACCIGPASADYELSNHTRGVSATFADQLNSKNLINIEAAVISAYNFRGNNTTMFTSSRGAVAWLVDSTSPLNGICYNYNAGAPVPVPCNPNGILNPTRVRFNDSPASVAGLGGLPVTAAGAATCGGGPCQFYVAENGANGGGNLGRPTFSSAAITDQFKATDKLLINIGLRYDRYDFKGSDVFQAPGTTNGSARAFWFNAYNQEFCTPPGVAQVPIVKTGDPSLSCAATFGAGYTAAHITPLPFHTNTYSETQPRIGATYTINPDNVLRFSYGKYSEAPNAAFQQYNVLQQNLAGYDNRFQSSGFNTTSRGVGAEVSNNYDFSLEHHFANTDASFKLTPYYRTTSGQIQNFFLDQKTGFVSGLNAGKQTASGVEFQLNDGDFGRNGLAASLSYTYTHSTIKFTPFANGTTVLDSFNQGVSSYNDFTSYCATNFATALCGKLAAAPATASACFDPAASGAPVACGPATVANPYFNAPVRPLFDTGASYLPFSTIPGGLSSATGSYITPHAATLVVNFKHDKFALTPSFQFFGGGYYGSPFNTPGIDPTTCGAVLGSTVSGDPRYKYGAPGGAPYDGLSCAGALTGGIPNPVTGNFDNLGVFKQPNQFLMHMQLSYEASSRVTFVANVANIIDTCSGGTSEPWTRFADHRVCGYGLPSITGSGFYGPAGNFYNPTSSFQPEQQYSYQQFFGTSPVQAFLQMKVKL